MIITILPGVHSTGEWYKKPEFSTRFYEPEIISTETALEEMIRVKSKEYGY